MTEDIERSNRRLHWMFAAAMTMVCSSCMAVSRLGTAKVSDAGGVPCFSVPLDAETKEGLPLYTIAVTETKSADGMKTLPGELWHFTAANLASPLLLRLPNCIPYGQSLASTVDRFTKVDTEPVWSVRKILDQLESYPEEARSIAEFGGRWTVTAGPNLNYTADVNHYAAKKMFLAPLKDNKSAADYLLESIRKLTK